jgi:hypothetical protein
LLQKIEKLEEELSTYKENKSKNWFSVQSSHYLLYFFEDKKRDMCHYHISGVA